MVRDADRAAWEAGKARHPGVELPLEAFAGYLAGREPAHPADLYLACALAAGMPAALAIFEAELGPQLRRGLAALRLPAAELDELVQNLRTRMLVGSPPEIVKYDGRGPLAGWLYVCAVRLGRRQAEALQRGVELEPDLASLAPVADPELLHLRRHYAEAFKACFEAAVGDLTPRERNLLRHQVLDRLGIDQIAAIHHVHRATAARRLEAARQRLVERTRARLSAELGLSDEELDSVMGLIHSAVDVTLRRVLG